MRKPLGIGFALLIAAGILGTVLGLLSSEPSYQGKCLSDWVAMMRDGPDRDKGREVVHALGTNALPLLLKWLRKKDCLTLRGRFESTKARIDSWLVDNKLRKPHETRGYWDRKESYRALAMLAFFELGPEGKPAIPALIRMLGEKSRKPDEISPVAGVAFVILSQMTPDAIPSLIEALSSPDQQVRLLAAGALGRFGPKAKAAIPVLETWYNDPKIVLRVSTADIVGQLGGDTNKLVPIIIQSLRDPDLEMLGYKLDVLLRYKEHAKAAIPVLLDLLKTIPASTNETNIFLRQQVRNAIREIESGIPP